MAEKLCLVMLPVAAGGVLEFSVRATSSMHAASIARNRCEQAIDRKRRVRVIPGGKPCHERGAAAHNGKQPCYEHMWRQIFDWELATVGRCHVQMSDAKISNIVAESVMEAVGLAVLQFQRKGPALATMTLLVGKYRPFAVDPEEYWSWLLQDDPTGAAHEGEQRAKAMLRDKHAIPLTREEKRARQER